MTTVYGDITPTQAAYSAKTLLERAIPYMILEQFGNLKPLPANNTKTINFRRHKLPIPTDSSGFALSEGVTPTALTPTMENYDLTLTQYGAVLGVTDIVDDTHIDNVLTEYMGLLGENAGQVVELMRWESIRTGTASNTILAGNVNAENLVTTSLTKAELRAALRSIRANHGRPITKLLKSDVRYGTQSCEPSYIAIIHSDLEGTIRENLGAGFTPVADYGSGATVMQGEFGNFENIRFVSSSLIGKRANAGISTGTATTLLSDAGSLVNLYDVCVFASDAWCGVALKGEFAVAPTMVRAKPTESDPLAQRSKCGYKTMQGAKVTQVAHIKKIVCGALKSA
jgi:N4-gp56 family major capsid protein